MLLLHNCPILVMTFFFEKSHTIETMILSQAKRNGANAVEFDLEWTLDGVPVILHDDTVDRTTDGKGAVNAKTYQSLQQLDAAAKHHKRQVQRKESFSRFHLKSDEIEIYLFECYKNATLIFTLVDQGPVCW